jgi:hypothetical protein
MEYLHWDQKDIKHDDDITSLYNNGYVFTRIQKMAEYQQKFGENFGKIVEIK